MVLMLTITINIRYSKRLHNNENTIKRIFHNFVKNVWYSNVKAAAPSI